MGKRSKAAAHGSDNKENVKQANKSSKKSSKGSQDNGDNGRSNGGHTTDDAPDGINPYAVLELDKSANAEEIRKGYRKQALLHHPDKVAPELRDAANKKFQEIAYAFAVLSDAGRRLRYDQTGSTRESVAGDRDFDWQGYFDDRWESMVNGNTLAEFKAQYQGSEEERTDLLEHYTTGKGDMEHILNHLLCSTSDDEPRLRSIIDEAISTKQVPAFKRYTKESSASREKRKANAASEAAEAEDLARELGLDKVLAGVSKKPDDDNALAMIIKKRAASRMDDLIGNLEAKYSKKSKQDKPKKVHR